MNLTILHWIRKHHRRLLLLKILIEIKSVLVVDDNESDRYLAKRAFVNSGLCETVYTVNHGVEAIEFLSNKEEQKSKLGDCFPPSLILLDLNMPQMNGFEFMQAYQDKNFDYDSSIFVMLTTSINEIEKERIKEIGVVSGYINKPVMFSNLKEIIQPYFEALI